MVVSKTLSFLDNAAGAAGKNFVREETVADFPRGCYYPSCFAFFNAHAVGAGNDNAQLLCAAVTTGAPPPQTDARACAPARAGALRESQ